MFHPRRDVCGASVAPLLIYRLRRAHSRRQAPPRRSAECARQMTLPVGVFIDAPLVNRRGRLHCTSRQSTVCAAALIGPTRAHGLRTCCARVRGVATLTINNAPSMSEASATTYRCWGAAVCGRCAPHAPAFGNLCKKKAKEKKFVNHSTSPSGASVAGSISARRF